MDRLHLDAPSEAATEAWARRIAPLLRAGWIVGLSGSLGAGKTTLARALARALGVSAPVTSPTFVLAREYPLPPERAAGPALAGGDRPAEPRPRRLLHLDLYRLSSAEVPELMADVEEALSEGAVALVEWPERAGQPFEDLRIRLSLRPPDEGTSHGPPSPPIRLRRGAGEGSVENEVTEVVVGDEAGEGIGAGEARWLTLSARSEEARALLAALVEAPEARHG